MREITISGESICSAPYCSQFSLVEGSICSICFTVFVVPALQCISVSSVIVCTAYCTLCTMQHPSSSCCISLGSPTKRTPDVFIVEITSRSGENTGIHRKRGKRRSSSISGSPDSSYLFGNPIKPWLMLLLLILKLDWCFYIWFWSHQHCSEILWRMFLLDWSLHHYLSEHS